MLLLTSLISLLGFVFASQLSDGPPYDDDTTNVRVIEMQEELNDTDPPIGNSTSLDFFVAGFSFIYTVPSLTTVISRNIVTPRLTFLYHVQPRSPPLQLTA
jgi:hypothetical protein